LQASGGTLPYCPGTAVVHAGSPEASKDAVGKSDGVGVAMSRACSAQTEIKLPRGVEVFEKGVPELVVLAAKLGDEVFRSVDGYEMMQVEFEVERRVDAIQTLELPNWYFIYRL
jgi:hypothetical protein